MAAAGLDTVISLSRKAEELYNKCHYERSLQKLRAALAAAQELGAEDCVIVAALTAEAARVSVLAESVRERHLTQAFFLETFAQYAASAAILRRRRDAGTLLRGMCRPDEERWQRESIRPKYPSTTLDSHMAATVSLVGYDAFLLLFCDCVESEYIASKSRVLEPGGEAERTYFSFLCDLCDEAVALMMLPREMNGHRSFAETGTYMRIQELNRRVVAMGGAQRRWRVRIAVALVRLRQSGIVQERGLCGAELIQSYNLAQQKYVRRVQERREAAASGRLRTCALASCGAREAHLSHFSKCGACKAVVYCCKEHQQADWPAHKAACKAAVAAKDAA